MRRLWAERTGLWLTPQTKKGRPQQVEGTPILGGLTQGSPTRPKDLRGQWQRSFPAMSGSDGGAGLLRGEPPSPLKPHKPAHLPPFLQLEHLSLREGGSGRSRMCPPSLSPWILGGSPQGSPEKGLGKWFLHFLCPHGPRGPVPLLLPWRSRKR